MSAGIFVSLSSADYRPHLLARAHPAVQMMAPRRMQDAMLNEGAKAFVPFMLAFRPHQEF